MSLITSLTRTWLTRTTKPFTFQNEYDQLKNEVLELEKKHKEIYEEYVIYAVFINEYSNYNFNYSEFNVENELRYSIIATENGKREEHKNYVDLFKSINIL